MRDALQAVSLAMLFGCCTTNMISGEYKIANPNSLSKVAYSTEYQAEYFDVYSQLIRTRYSEVYWKLGDPVPLPSHITKRFENKTMAVVGYEVDQVTQTASGDIPVPITSAYNHHYMAWLTNSRHARMAQVTADPEAIRMGHNHGADHYWRPETLPNTPPSAEDISVSTWFSEGNGGEMRLSYHGYPKGYAQLVESPTIFQINPMQIDTKNRDHKGPGFKPGPLPRSALAPPNASYSGLLECPCTDRLTKEIYQAYSTQSKGSCQEFVQNASECFTAATKVAIAGGYSTHVVSNSSLPLGCSVNPNAQGSVDVFWNEARTGSTCGNGSSTLKHVVAFMQTSVVNVTVELRQDKSDGEAVLTLVGPADVWFGVGFGSGTMCLHSHGDECPDGGPYAVIVAGDGPEAVTERKLDDHGPGSVLRASLTVRSNSAEQGTRTVVLTRPLQGLTPHHFTFDLQASSVPFISARGKSLTFAQHVGHASSTLNFLTSGTSSCVCRDGIQGKIDGAPFPHPSPCSAEPTGDLLKQKNPTCSVQTYSGGLRCCRHGHYLLDADQAVPEGYQEYQLKFRFYFEEYVPGKAPSHKNLVRLYWQTEALAGEYDIVPCLPGVPSQDCVQVITSRWKIRDMLTDCPLRQDATCTGVGSTDPDKTAGIKLIYAGPHCHAPDCLSMELYNADTGRLLCHMEPTFGKSDRLYDEKGYVALPPCLWGDVADGLLEPELLGLDTELLSIKRNNNTVGHYGEMASWQMRGIVVPKQSASQDASGRSSRHGWMRLAEDDFLV